MSSAGAPGILQKETLMIQLIPFDQNDYHTWREQAEKEYAADIILAGNHNASEAAEKSRNDFETALPDGLASPNQWIYSIANEAGEKVGMIWFQCIERSMHKEAFILDLVVFEPYRRKGYAHQAMQAIEEVARQHGMDRIALHVFGHNSGAIRLYEKLGYAATNIQMAKSLR
jgi:ribosomal protein S18 acetylase RimI-like enzyme